MTSKRTLLSFASLKEESTGRVSTAEFRSKKNQLDACRFACADDEDMRTNACERAIQRRTSSSPQIEFQNKRCEGRNGSIDTEYGTYRRQWRSSSSSKGDEVVVVGDSSSEVTVAWEECLNASGRQRVRLCRCTCFSYLGTDSICCGLG